jgi:uncharacterized protein (DUF983 family)
MSDTVLDPPAPHTRLTHYRPGQDLTIFRGRPARMQQAYCGAQFLFPAEWSVEPTCPACRAEMAAHDALDIG